MIINYLNAFRFSRLTIMKKLILLLLFIPLVSFGQITYKDLMKLKNQQAFVKLMFDKQFSTYDRDDDSVYESLYYALNPKKQADGEYASSHFIRYTPTINTFYFSFIRGVMANNYDTIFKKVKRKCEFIKMYKLGKQNYACYSCKDAEYRGYLGFSIIEGWGTIANIPNID